MFFFRPPLCCCELNDNSMVVEHCESLILQSGIGGPACNLCDWLKFTATYQILYIITFMYWLPYSKNVLSDVVKNWIVCNLLIQQSYLFIIFQIYFTFIVFILSYMSTSLEKSTDTKKLCLLIFYRKNMQDIFTQDNSLLSLIFSWSTITMFWANGKLRNQL